MARDNIEHGFAVSFTTTALDDMPQHTLLTIVV